MKKLLLLALVPMLTLALAFPPANGVTYTPEELRVLNRPLSMCIFTCYPMVLYDSEHGAWYYYYYDTGVWHWA